MIKEYLNQPYPLSVSKWKLIISISLFIGLFMIIFQPFGFSGYIGPYKTLLGMGYGLVTFFVLIFDLYFFQYLFKKQFDNRYWKVWKQLAWLFIIIFSIGLGNFLYTSVLNSAWSLRFFLFFQLYTLMVGIIPIVVLTVIQQNLMLSQNLKSAQEFNNSIHQKTEVSGKETVCLIADNEKDRVELDLSSILYIESSGNYIEIYFLNGQLVKSTLLRSTLKRTEIQLEEFPSMQKCHRAFLVNINNIIQVKGNSQGLKLVLKNTETEIPVSRNFAKNLKDQLNPNV